MFIQLLRMMLPVALLRFIATPVPFMELFSKVTLVALVATTKPSMQFGYGVFIGAILLFAIRKSEPPDMEKAAKGCELMLVM